MESLPVGWTVYTCDQEGDRAGLLNGGVHDANNTRVCDLFHEDAQVGSESLNFRDSFVSIPSAFSVFHCLSFKAFVLLLLLALQLVF